jgi:O-antigen/teichoic acid export membrane protein
MLHQFKLLAQRFDPRRRSHDFRRSLRNAVYSTADYLLLPILWLITTPIFVSRLGVDQYGIWMLVNTFLGFSGIMGFGLSNATIKYVSKYRALGDDVGVARVVRSTLTMYGALGILAGAVAFLAAPLLVHHVFKVGSENTTLAVVALQIGGVGIIVRFLDSVFQSAIYGYERYDLATRVTMVTNAVTMMINVALVLNGYGLVEILITTIILIGVGGIVKAILAKYLLIPNLGFTPLFDKAALREIFSFGFYSWLQSLGGILLHQVDRFLIASLLNTSALTYYVVSLQLAQQIHAVLARAVSFVFPLSSAVKEAGDLQRLRRIYFKGLNFTTVAAVAIGLPLFIFSRNILTLWMGSSFADEAAGLLRILTFVFALLATSIVPYYYLNGTGFVRLNTLFGMISGTIVTIAALLLIPWLGIAGAAWARLANTPTGIISRTIVHYKVLADYRWYAGLSIILPVFVPFTLGLILLTLFSEPRIVNHFALAMQAGSYGFFGAVLAAVFCWLFNSPRRVLVS